MIGNPAVACQPRATGLFRVRRTGYGRGSREEGIFMKLVTTFGLGLAVLVFGVSPAAAKTGRLEMYTLTGDSGAIAKATQGVELAGQRQTASGFKTDAVLTRAQVSKLRAEGVKV